MRVIDGDAHFLEPLDLFEHYIDPAYSLRAPHRESELQSALCDGDGVALFDRGRRFEGDAALA